MNRRDALPINIVIVAPPTAPGWENRHSRREPATPPPNEERSRSDQPIPGQQQREALRRNVELFRKATQAQREAVLGTAKAMLGT
jgi:hypothetical protein